MGNIDSTNTDPQDAFLGVTWRADQNPDGASSCHVSVHIGYRGRPNAYSDLLPDLDRQSFRIVDGNRVVQHMIGQSVAPLTIMDFLRVLPSDLVRTHRLEGHVFIETGMRLMMCQTKSRWKFVLSDSYGGFLRDVRAPAYTGPLTDLLCLLSKAVHRESERLCVSLDIRNRKGALDVEDRATIRALAHHSPVQHLRLGVQNCDFSGHDVDLLVSAFLDMPGLRTVALHLGDDAAGAVAWRGAFVARSPTAARSSHALFVWIAGPVEHRDSPDNVTDLRYDRRVRVQVGPGDLYDDRANPWRRWLEGCVPEATPYRFEDDDDPPIADVVDLSVRDVGDAKFREGVRVCVHAAPGDPPLRRHEWQRLLTDPALRDGAVETRQPLSDAGRAELLAAVRGLESDTVVNELVLCTEDLGHWPEILDAALDRHCRFRSTRLDDPRTPDHVLRAWGATALPCDRVVVSLAFLNKLDAWLTMVPDVRVQATGFETENQQPAAVPAVTVRALTMSVGPSTDWNARLPFSLYTDFATATVRDVHLELRHRDMDTLLGWIASSARNALADYRGGRRGPENLRVRLTLRYAADDFTGGAGVRWWRAVVRVCNAAVGWELGCPGNVTASVAVGPGDRSVKLTHATFPQLAEKMDEFGVHPTAQTMWTSGRVAIAYPVRAYPILPGARI